jgi:hypothetical protein
VIIEAHLSESADEKVAGTLPALEDRTLMLRGKEVPMSARVLRAV